MKKAITWVSPKEYQTNHIPRNPHKLKPKKYCKKLKGQHNLKVIDETKGVYFKKIITLACIACGHKEYKFYD